MASIYEKTMKEVLGKLDRVDGVSLMVMDNNKMSTAITLALAEIMGFEKNLFRHGSIATLLEVKRILLEAEQ